MVKTTADEMPNLQNATPEFLADELGETRAKKSKLERLEGYLKEAAKGKIKTGEAVQGEKYSLARAARSQLRINKDAVHNTVEALYKEVHGEAMTEDWFDGHCKKIIDMDVLSSSRLD